MTLFPGQILLVNLRDALPKEPSKLRPCILVENRAIFGDNYENVIIVPLSSDPTTSLAMIMTPIDPTIENGCPQRCYAVAGHVTSTSRARIMRVTKSQITEEQLADIRAKIVLAIAA